jgi:POT family proton-dependent oligopeptide transporter
MESSYGRLCRSLKSKTQLVFTIILSALSFGWYNLGWAFWFTVLFYRNSSFDDDDLYKRIVSARQRSFCCSTVVFIMVIIFWGAFEQAGGLMNLYTDKQIGCATVGTYGYVSEFKMQDYTFATGVAGFGQT